MAFKSAYFIFFVIITFQYYRVDTFLCIIPTRLGPALADCPFQGHPGNCTEMMDCGFKYPESYTFKYKCYSDVDCPEGMKCCDHPCYHHKVCVLATLPNGTIASVS